MQHLHQPHQPFKYELGISLISVSDLDPKYGMPFGSGSALRIRIRIQEAKRKNKTWTRSEDLSLRWKNKSKNPLRNITILKYYFIFSRLPHH